LNYRFRTDFCTELTNSILAFTIDKWDRTPNQKSWICQWPENTFYELVVVENSRFAVGILMMSVILLEM